MADVSRAINKYITNYIQLSKNDISSSARSREWFLNRLDSVISKRMAEPVLFSSKRMLYFGSYFKGTKVKVVDEYDVLIVLDSNSANFSMYGQAYGVGQGTNAYPNYLLDCKYRKSDDSGVSPSKLLNWLKGVAKEVIEPYGGEIPERNGQAITAIIKSKNLKIDLVPACIFSRNSDGSIFYCIPKGSSDGSWIITSPETDIKNINDIAVGRVNFKNVIRIIKRIKEKYNFLVSSFSIETAVVNYVMYNVWYCNLHYDVRGALSYLSQAFKGGRIQDPYDTNTNLLEGVQNLNWYAERIDIIIATIDYCSSTAIDPNIVDVQIVKKFEND